jgi:hypothetical protein
VTVVLAYLSKKRGALRSRKRAKYADPLTAGRHPFQTFLMVLGLASGVSLLAAETNSASLEAQLPSALVTGWYLALILGSAMTLLGAYWPRSYDTALTMERAGLDISGFAAVVYAGVVVVNVGLAALYPVSIIVAFGAACIVRARDIGFIFYMAREHVDGGTQVPGGGVSGG